MGVKRKGQVAKQIQRGGRRDGRRDGWAKIEQPIKRMSLEGREGIIGWGRDRRGEVLTRGG